MAMERRRLDWRERKKGKHTENHFLKRRGKREKEREKEEEKRNNKVAGKTRIEKSEICRKRKKQSTAKRIKPPA